MGYDNDFQEWDMAKLMDTAEEYKDEIEKALHKAGFDDKKFFDVLEMERELTRREE